MPTRYPVVEVGDEECVVRCPHCAYAVRGDIPGYMPGSPIDLDPPGEEREEAIDAVYEEFDQLHLTDDGAEGQPRVCPGDK